MSRLITIWLDICLLRAGPQDLPSSRTLLGLTGGTYFLVSLLLSLPAYPAKTAFLVALLDLGLLAAFAAALLYFPGKWARLQQTLTALTGTGTLLGLLALPLAYLLFQGPEENLLAGVAALIWLFLFGWSLLVVAHIMRHALSIAFPYAIGIAVLYTLVALQLMAALFPGQTD
ncbi:MAG: hypothetical protein OEN52_11905 [Gammaproteobacteria bacterium]|nr:hypothetical protein [Gammaproteobacteria bacterium]